MVFRKIFSAFGALSVTGVAVVAFSHYVVELFGVSIPNLFWPVFKDIGAGFIVGIAFIFAIAWFINAKPHKRPKNYSKDHFRDPI